MKWNPFLKAVSGLPDPADKEGRSETDSQMSGSEDQKSNFDKDLNKVSKSSHSINKSKKSSSKKSRNRWIIFLESNWNEQHE